MNERNQVVFVNWDHLCFLRVLKVYTAFKILAGVKLMIISKKIP